MFFFSFLSRFTDPFEKKCFRFLEKLSSRPRMDHMHETLLFLMQEDLVRFNLLLEWKAKGYRHLGKKVRRKAYENAEKIREYLGVRSQESGVRGKRAYLEAIRQFLLPGKRVQYRESSSFERLLKDPSKEKLVGDCNQLVTLYVYLYSLRYPITDLKLKLLPEHVCLHFEGEDLETTTGEWMLYKKFDRLADVFELPALNLLDTADKAHQRESGSPLVQLQIARLVALFSQEKKIAEHNLSVAYQRACTYLTKEHEWHKARRYAKASRDSQLQTYVLEAELHHLWQHLPKGKYITDFKGKASTLRRIKALAQRTNKSDIVSFCQNILRKI